jgi:hypothetical protein
MGPGGGSASATTSLRSGFEGRARGQMAVQWREWAKVFWSESPCFGDHGDDAFGCCYPLGGVVESTFAELGLRVKTLDLDLVGRHVVTF